MEKGSGSSSNPGKGKSPMTTSDAAAPPVSAPLPMQPVQQPLPPLPPVPVLLQDLNQQPPPPEPVMFRCIVCPRQFPTEKALFGHMRSHPDRGWRGAFPPPTFNRNEFADVAHLLGDAEADVGGAGHADAAGGNQGGGRGAAVNQGAARGGGRGGRGDVACSSHGGGRGEGGSSSGGNSGAYRVPDLNESPPKE